MTEPFDALKTKFALTEAQWIVLVAVQQIGGDGWPVTVRAAAAYASSTVSSSHRMLKELEQLELLESNPRFRGGWRITDRGHYVTNA